MPYPFYKVAHLAAIMLLFLAWGGLVFKKPAASDAAKGLKITHGLALLFILVAGFGLLARLGIHWPWPMWVWGKLAIWLALGASLAINKRLPQHRPLLGVLLPVLGALAAYLAVYKPW